MQMQIQIARFEPEVGRSYAYRPGPYGRRAQVTISVGQVNCARSCVHTHTLPRRPTNSLTHSTWSALYSGDPRSLGDCAARRGVRRSQSSSSREDPRREREREGPSWRRHKVTRVGAVMIDGSYWLALILLLPRLSHTDPAPAELALR